MAGPLASLYSALDSSKRKVADALANPGAAFEQFVGHKNDQAGEGLSLLRKSQGPGEKPTAEGQDARSKIIEALSEGYNPAGILAGPMAKTADFGALKKAVQMEMKKAPAPEIWHETGWGRGLDKRWRYEIPDQGSKLGELVPNPAYAQGTLVTPQHKLFFDEAFEHPELFEAYPQLRTTGARLIHDPGMKARYNGSFSRGQNGSPGTMVAAGQTPQYLQDTVLHEGQHMVQDLEKFAGGGSPQQFAGLANTTQDAFEMYYRLKGEAEARLIEGRARLPINELRNVYPWQPDQFKSFTGVYPDMTHNAMPGPLSRR